MHTIRNAALLMGLMGLGAAPGISQTALAADAAPSFSCTGPDLSATEQRICGDAELAHYDQELASLYRSRVTSAPASEMQQLTQDEQTWLQKRNACGDSVDCIKGAYLTRIYDLQTRATPVTPSGQADQADQVNGAVPLSNAAQTALNKTRRLVSDRTAMDGIQAQFVLKLKLRALNCIQSLGIAPGLSRNQIHDSYGGSPCFVKEDDDIADWLGMRAVGYLATLPPLRPMPAKAPLSFTDEVAPINSVRFAAQAGVAVVETMKDVEVMDLARASPISSHFRQNTDGSLLTVTPNGRVYISGNYQSYHFFDSEDGTHLADADWNQFASNCGFPWLDRQTALIRTSQPGYSTAIYDLASGATAPLDSRLGSLTCVTPVPGADDTFMGYSGGGFALFKLVHGSDGKPRADVMQVKDYRLNPTSTPNPGLIADGRRYVVATNGQLIITSLSDLSLEAVDFGGFDVRFVVPTSDPDKLIISGEMKRGSSGNSPPFYIYALKERSVSSLDTAGLKENQFIYDPVQDTLYTLRDSALIRADNFNVGSPAALATFAADMTRAVDEANAAAAAAMPYPSRAYSMSYGSTGSLSVNRALVADSVPSRPAPDSVSQLAQDADVEGIGIIDSNATAAGQAVIMAGATSNSPPTKAVNVVIHDHQHPLVLVLSSQAAVAWQLTITPGVQLAAVLLSGPNGGSVQGQGNAPVVAIGSAYSYAVGAPGYPELQTEVFNWTGKRMKLLQSGGPEMRFNIY
jgi:uncharacterized protein